MPRSILIPITNVYAKGDYTAEVRIGSEQRVARLILDSGSSSLVVQREDYDPAEDTELVATEYAQNVVYGMGGWYGPVVRTLVCLGRDPWNISLNGVHVAVANKEMTGCFGLADGILGLAYCELNKARDLTTYMTERGIDPALTYPWSLDAEQADDSVGEFRTFLRQFPSHIITSYFTQLEDEDIVADQFAFIIHRSSIYQTPEQKTTEELKQHPLNNGIFILGEPRLQSHLHDGHFSELKVLDDKYYNVHLHHMQVGNRSPIAAPPLAEADVRGHVSNAIMDTGASMIMLPQALFESLFDELIGFNPEFAPILEPFRSFEGVEEGVEMSQVNLEEWPDLYFTFEGFDEQQVTLSMTPHTYWQTHAPAPGLISFQFVHLAGWPDQTVFGLPFLNNYFTVFDRAEREHGSVQFARKKFDPHTLRDRVHANLDRIRTLFEHSPLPF